MIRKRHLDEFGAEQRRWYGLEAGAIAGIVAAAAAVAGTAVSVYGASKAADDAAAASKYNQQVAFRQAEQARAAAKIKAEQQSEADRRLQATVRAKIGGAGVELGEGSTLLVLMENAAQAERSKAEIEYGGELTAAGLEARGRMEGAYGANARTAGYVGAGASLLAGVGRVASSYTPGRTSARTVSSSAYQDA